jgi:hypothetical protein
MENPEEEIREGRGEEREDEEGKEGIPGIAEEIFV